MSPHLRYAYEDYSVKHLEHLANLENSSTFLREILLKSCSGKVGGVIEYKKIPSTSFHVIFSRAPNQYTTQSEELRF